MPTDMDKAFGGYSTFRPHRHGEDGEEVVDTDKRCQDEDLDCEQEKRELLAKWFRREVVNEQ